jgi:hypothetical protein
MASEEIVLTQYSHMYIPYRWGIKDTVANVAGPRDRYPGSRMNMSFVIGVRDDDGTFDLIHHKNPNGIISEWKWSATTLTITTGADIEP